MLRDSTFESGHQVRISKLPLGLRNSPTLAPQGWRGPSVPPLVSPSGGAHMGVQVPVFGLWRVRFPPVLVRTGRRLPVQALGERGVLVTVTGYPRGGAPGPG